MAILLLMLLGPSFTISGEQEDRRGAGSHVTAPASLVRLLNAAEQFQVAGNFREAEAHCREALQEAERTTDPLVIAIVTSRLASVVHDQGRFGEAEVLYLRVVALRTKVHGGTHAEVALALAGLGVLLAETRRYPEAEQALKQAEDIQRRAADTPADDRALVVSGLATLARYRGNRARAESLYLRALDLLYQSVGPVHPYIGTAHQNLAILYAETGQWNHVQLQNQQAMEQWRKTLGAAHPAFALGQVTLADLLVSNSRWGQAEPLLQDAIRLLQASLGAEHAELAIAKCKLAEVYRHLKRPAEATAILEKITADGERTPGPLLATALVGLARFRAEADSRESALRLAKRALDVAVETSGEQHPITAYVLHQQAKMFRGLGLRKEARECEHRAAAILDRQQIRGSGHTVDWRSLMHVPPLHR
ncbi:MAG: tetratricopeptide repeat protein [Bryobacteraceae bacterium]|nr:tetratricopeptide repeat protein [Bryobacteraceae bacterium]